MKRVAIALIAFALMGVGGARADELCRGHGWPMTPVVEPNDRLETHRVAGEKVNVLLPTGYDSNRGRGYPVLYVLHGANWGAEEGPDMYLAYMHLVELTEDEDVIVVMPYAGRFGSSADWRDGSQRWESFFINDLLPWVDGQYRTVADRSGRAIAGESLGGLAAMSLSARHPDLFVAAGSFSGALDASFGDLAWFAVFSAIGIECGGDGGGAWSDPVTAGMDMRDLNPADLAGNLGGLAVYFDTGNGIPCGPEDIARPGRAGGAELSPVAVGIEAGVSYPMTRRFHDAIRASGVAHTSNMRTCGTHDFPYFEDGLRTFWPIMKRAFQRRLSEREVPFDHRRALPSFSVWDWTFAADPARAPEFLDVTDASCDGLGLSGSGTTTVTTARCFRPGSTVLVNDDAHTADAHGRLMFTVDLGPAHTNQQYTPAARALEAAGGYWVARTVRLRELP